MRYRIRATESNSLVIHPILWGFGPLLVVLAFFSPNFIAFRSYAAMSLLFPPYAYTSLCATFVASVGVVILSFRKNGLQALLISGIVFHLISVTGFILFLKYPDIDLWLSQLVAIFGGIGSVALCVMWGRIYANLNMKSALFNISISLVFYILIEYLFSLVDWNILALLFGLCEFCTVVIPLVGGAYTGKTLSLSPKMSRSFLLEMKDTFLAPTTGLIVFALLMALRRGGIGVLDDTALRTGFLLAAGCIFMLTFVRFDRPFIAFFYRVILPCIAAVVVLMTFISNLLGFHLYDGVFLYWMFGIVGALSIASASALGRNREADLSVLVSGICMLYSLASLIGLLIVENAPIVIEGENGSLIFIIGTMIYLMFITLYPAIRAWSEVRLDGALSKERLPKPVGVDDRCDNLSQQFDLTARETEILKYLAHGHTAKYVSETLLITESTARTHIKNIHRKLGVSSRDEIILLVKDESEGAAEATLHKKIT